MYGTPKRIYVDNGLVYGAHFERVCADLGIEVTHAPPYKSWVRGKKERFLRFLARPREDTAWLHRRKTL